MKSLAIMGLIGLVLVSATPAAFAITNIGTSPSCFSDSTGVRYDNWFSWNACTNSNSDYYDYNNIKRDFAPIRAYLSVLENSGLQAARNSISNLELLDESFLAIETAAFVAPNRLLGNEFAVSSDGTGFGVGDFLNAMALSLYGVHGGDTDQTLMAAVQQGQAITLAQYAQPNTVPIDSSSAAGRTTSSTLSVQQLDDGVTLIERSNYWAARIGLDPNEAADPNGTIQAQLNWAKSFFNYTPPEDGESGSGSGLARASYHDEYIIGAAMAASLGDPHVPAGKNTAVSIGRSFYKGETPTSMGVAMRVGYAGRMSLVAAFSEDRNRSLYRLGYSTAW
ncbi:MAG: YadA-like family protein [Gammaproteobacteria bacterium]